MEGTQPLPSEVDESWGKGPTDSRTDLNHYWLFLNYWLTSNQENTRHCLGQILVDIRELCLGILT